MINSETEPSRDRIDDRPLDLKLKYGVTLAKLDGMLCETELYEWY